MVLRNECHCCALKSVNIGRLMLTLRSERLFGISLCLRERGEKYFTSSGFVFVSEPPQFEAA